MRDEIVEGTFSTVRPRVGRCCLCLSCGVWCLCSQYCWCVLWTYEDRCSWTTTRTCPACPRPRSVS